VNKAGRFQVENGLLDNILRRSAYFVFFERPRSDFFEEPIEKVMKIHEESESVNFDFISAIDFCDGLFSAPPGLVVELYSLDCEFACQNIRQHVCYQTEPKIIVIAVVMAAYTAIDSVEKGYFRNYVKLLRSLSNELVPKLILPRAPLSDPGFIQRLFEGNPFEVLSNSMLIDRLYRVASFLSKSVNRTGFVYAQSMPTPFCCTCCYDSALIYYFLKEGSAPSARASPVWISQRLSLLVHEIVIVFPKDFVATTPLDPERWCEMYLPEVVFILESRIIIKRIIRVMFLMESKILNRAGERSRKGRTASNCQWKLSKPSYTR
jgi:hypothetical protein